MTDTTNPLLQPVVRLGELIRSRRRARGLTQEQLAEQVGVQQATVSEWETGRALPKQDTLARVQALLGISDEEARATIMHDDEVVRALSKTHNIPADVRDALLTLYREAVTAHRNRT